MSTTVTARPVDLRPARARARRAHLALTAATFAGIYVVLAIVLHLDLVFTRTTAAGGDMGSHHYVATFLRTDLLPEGKVTGWAPGWYAGIPMLTFYFPLPYALIAALSPVLGAQVAFKVVSVSGLFILPLSAWAAVRVLRLPEPVPLFTAVATLPFMFMTSYAIYGGNIASTMAGEFPFAFSFALLPLALALCWRVAETGRGATVTALLVTALVLSHILTTIMLVLAVLVLLVRPGLPAVARALWRLARVFGLAFLLCAFWALPFIFRVTYTAHFQWTQLTDLALLIPAEIRPYQLLGLVGVVVAVRRRERRVLLLAWPIVVGVVLFAVLPRVLPSAPLWNARMLPFIYLFSLLLAAYGAAALAGRVARALRHAAGVTAPTAYALAVVAAVVVATLTTYGQRDFLPGWAQYNYRGFEVKNGWPEAEALFAELDALPAGRVMWEYNRGYESFGTTRTLENIPVFTDQPTMEGLLIESSLNAPFHFITQAETSERSTHAVPGLDYPEFDFERGLEHMRVYGVRYFVAFTEKVKKEAEAAGLPVVGEVPAPDATAYVQSADEQTTADGGFVIYEVGDGDLVEVPPYRPVMTADTDWRGRSLEWFRDPDALPTPLVFTSDPAARDLFVPEPDDLSGPGDLPREPLADPGPVADVRWVDNERLEFTTDRVGEPHVVKVSWFPNWQADGADGPWLLSPGLMVVVPTQPDVALVYRDTPLEIAGKAMTLAGLAVLIGTAVLWARRRATPADPDTATPDTEEPNTQTEDTQTEDTKPDAGHPDAKQQQPQSLSTSGDSA